MIDSDLKINLEPGDVNLSNKINVDSPVKVEITVTATPRPGMTLDELEVVMQQLGNTVISRDDVANTLTMVQTQ